MRKNIDPPYNTGARDWKYNNDYVDASDAYRHSKWLSMMEKRLKLAKKLLNSEDSVLICTIDEKEYLHLGCLLEELFPEARIQMVSSAINPKGVARNGFSRNDEYIYFVMLGACAPTRLPLNNEWSASAIISNAGKYKLKSTPAWTSMMRRGSNSSRSHSPGCYYPIYVDPLKHVISFIGEPIAKEKNRAEDIDNLVQVLPIRRNGNQGCWQVSPEELKLRLKQGRIKLGKETSYGYVINYLPDGVYSELLSDMWVIDGRDSEGALVAHRNKNYGMHDLKIAPTQWKISSHNASENGSMLLGKFLPGRVFPFPKSLYAIHDAIRFFVANKPDALILDFFAGSGTTLHAVNLLNAEDGGHRRCIMVTNNEVSDTEAKALTKQGFKPGDPEWEERGIAHYVTWPRTVCSIKGHDVNGNPLKGDYLGNGDSEGNSIAMKDGFQANTAFFKLGFLDKSAVALGRQFKELLPVLWMKAGCIGPCPELKDEVTPDMLLLPENGFAVLTDEKQFPGFLKLVNQEADIRTVFIVTDSTNGFREMANQLQAEISYQLYRDYLDNFRINTGR